MYKWLCYLICCFLVTRALFSQDFTEATLNYGVEHQYFGNFYGGGVSFYDFNNDGWDDLSLPSGNGLSKFYVNQNGFFQEVSLIDDLSQVKSLIWVDYDNDGDADLSVTEYDGQIRIFKNSGDLSLQEISLDDSLNVQAYNSGISWADYDNDGLLDFYVSRYPEHDDNFILQDTPNQLYKQISPGSFINVTDSLDMGNGLQQSFISTWADFDDDLDMDIYVTNDRFSFPNAFYKNNGEGSFSDFSEESSADISIFAMTSTVGDYDNDGDLDIYCSNGFGGNHLMKNNGDATFEDQFPNSGAEAFAFSWGANWIDFDNNGWKDLFLCTSENNDNPFNRLFINNQDGTFNSTSGFDGETAGAAHGVAKGDFNNDGKYDLMVTYEAPYPSMLMMNSELSDNHYVKLKLEGTISNKDAIGSKITYYSDGQLGMEYTTCGSDYLSQDSQTKILGIGNSQFIDSLQIRWPSGLSEWHYNIAADSTLCAVEGNETSVMIDSGGITQICEGEEVTLSLNASYTDLLWSNDSISLSTTISEPGAYWVTISLSGELSFNSDTVYIQTTPELVIDEIIVQEPSCFGDDNGSVEILYSSESGILTESLSTSNLESGNHYFEIVLDNHCSSIVNVNIDEPSELFVLTSIQSASCFYANDGTVSFNAFGGTPSFEYSITPQAPIDQLSAGEYSFICEDMNGCLYQDDFSITGPDSLIYSLEVSHEQDGTSGSLEVINLADHEIANISIFNFNNEIQDDQNLSAGLYTIIIEDEFGCLYSDSFEVQFINSVLEYGDLNNSYVYPNPSSGVIYGKGIDLSKVLLFSIEGRQIELKIISSGENALDFSQLPRGVYMLRDNESAFSTLLFLE